MATRIEIDRRRSAMKKYLNEACHDGKLVCGSLAPSVRALSEQFQVSGTVTHGVLRELINDGLFHTVPGVGTFVGRRSQISEVYVHIAGYEADGSAASPLMVGFAERIAQLGGATWVLPESVAREYFRRESLPKIAGVFGPLLDERMRHVPHVSFAGHARHDDSDLVSYDDVDGGRQATQHLIGLGHTRIAFLALHPETGALPGWLWSQKREEGWRAALQNAGIAAANLAFHPRGSLKYVARDSRPAAAKIAEKLLQQPKVTAVVAANDFAALGLLDALTKLRAAPEAWPAVVGFDNLPATHGQIVTSLHLPAESLARTAADILWERQNGVLTGPPVHRHAPMSLLPRLTSRTGWSEMVDVSIAAF